jgi:hypothetical protein
VRTLLLVWRAYGRAITCPNNPRITPLVDDGRAQQPKRLSRYNSAAFWTMSAAHIHNLALTLSRWYINLNESHGALTSEGIHRFRWKPDEPTFCQRIKCAVNDLPSYPNWDCNNDGVPLSGFPSAHAHLAVDSPGSAKEL